MERDKIQALTKDILLCEIRNGRISTTLLTSNSNNQVIWCYSTTKRAGICHTIDIFSQGKLCHSNPSEVVGHNAYSGRLYYRMSDDSYYIGAMNDLTLMSTTTSIDHSVEKIVVTSPTNLVYILNEGS